MIIDGYSRPSGSSNLSIQEDNDTAISDIHQQSQKEHHQYHATSYTKKTITK